MEPLRQRVGIDLRLVPALAPDLQVKPMPGVVTDAVEALASHVGTEAEHL